jgi:hypothetical protein
MSFRLSFQFNEKLNQRQISDKLNTEIIKIEIFFLFFFNKMKIEEEEINIHEIAMTKEKAAELLAKN